MCGRYSLTTEQEALATALGVEALHHPTPRYNIAPTQMAPVLVVRRDGPVVRERRWGLVPHWTDTPFAGAPLINARSETVHSRPAFRDAFRRSRCLVPADGFFEWTGEEGRKVPWWIRRVDGRPFTFAGLEARWEGPGRDVVDSFTILTTEAADELRAIHDRMPVVVAPEHREGWLDPATPREELQRILGNAANDDWVSTRVSRRVNSPAHDDPACVEPVEDGSDDPRPPSQTTLF